MHFRAPLIPQTLDSMTNVLFRCLSRIDSLTELELRTAPRNIANRGSTYIV